MSAQTRPCSRCSSRKDTEPVTITDRSGGSLAHLCTTCRWELHRERCGFCGRVKHSNDRAEHVLEIERERSSPICNECREDLLFEGGAPA